MATTKEKKASAAPAKKAAAKAPKAAAEKNENAPFAVIMTGGKQYLVSVGDSVTIEKMKGEHKEGDVIHFTEVLLTSNGTDTVIGTPTVAGASVQGVITKIGRHKTITVLKYKQKSRYLKKNGHRQPYFKVSISAIK